ncbi:tetratricopeptide repeat protein [Leptothrix sp. BB-4]
MTLPIPRRWPLAAALIALFALLAGLVPAYAADMPSTASPADSRTELAPARRAIDKADWAGAIRELDKALARNERQPEAHTLMGLALRKSGQPERALKSYERALQLDPRSQGAHEYIGEAYLMLRQPEQARAHLVSLKQLCGEQCEAYRDLSQAIAAYKP